MNYRCFYCQKSFRSKSNLCRHLRDRVCCKPVEERKRFQCTFCEATFTTDDNRRRHEQFWCRRKPTLRQQIKQEPTEEPWLSRIQPERLEDRIEKLQILQHSPEVWRGFVHASNGSSYGYWLSQDGRLCYLGLDSETMKERLATIEECQRWMYA